MTKKKFLFNPNNPKKSFDVYVDKNPQDTIPIKYGNKREVLSTINELERLYKTKKRDHRRISQVAMIMRVRLRAIKDKNPKIDKGRLQIAEKYVNFLKSRTKRKTFDERKKMKF
jgi:hypothetical protein